MNSQSTEILLITWQPELDSVQRLVQEIERRQYCYRLVHPEMDQFGTPSVVLPRLGTHRFQRDIEILQPLAEKVRFINNLTGYQKTRNKWLLSQLLVGHQIPVPLTHLVNREELSLLSPEFPFVLKELFSSQGRGVFLIKTPSELKACLESRAEHEVFLVQEYIEESHGRDLRIFVTAKGDFWTMERRNDSGQIQSNLHAGGRAFAAEATAEEIDYAFSCLEIFGLDYAGVDILRSRGGSLLLEVNPCPGFAGLESLHGPVVAGKIVDLAL